MPTPLHKPVVREVVLAGRGGHPVTMVVTLLPNGLISFREKGRRRTTEVNLGHCHVLSEIIEARYEYREKMSTYKLKRKAGYRVRKPKMINLFYSMFYQKALK